MKKFLVVILSCALIFQGCTGVIVKKAKEPYETTAPKTISEEKILFISRVPPGQALKKIKLKLSKNYRVYQVEERIKGTPGKWKLFINEKRVALRNWGGKGANRKKYTGWVGPGHIFAARLVQENADSRLYKAEFIGRCGNEVEDLFILESPRLVAITERYRDIDYTPAIWAGITGLLLGYLFWFNPSAPPVVCGPGTPAPR